MGGWRGERRERERKDRWNFPVKPSSDWSPSDQLIIHGASVPELHSILKIQGWDHTTYISIFPVLGQPERIKEAGMLFPKCQTGEESIFTHSLLLYCCCPVLGKTHEASQRVLNGELQYFFLTELKSYFFRGTAVPLASLTDLLLCFVHLHRVSDSSLSTHLVAFLSLGWDTLHLRPVRALWGIPPEPCRAAVQKKKGLVLPSFRMLLGACGISIVFVMPELMVGVGSVV